MRRIKIGIVFLFLLLAPCALLAQEEIVLKGNVSDPHGNALPNALVQLIAHHQVVSQSKSGADGQFLLKIRSSGEFTIKVESPGFRTESRAVTVHVSGHPEIAISMSQVASRNENVTVTADINESDVLSPDPAEKVFVHQDLLDANPGRPGAPISIPG
jgi:hypothetical protein